MHDGLMICLISYPDVPITLEQGKTGLIRPRDFFSTGVETNIYTPYQIEAFLLLSFTDKWSF